MVDGHAQDQCWCWLCVLWFKRHWIGRLDNMVMCGHVHIIVWFRSGNFSWLYQGMYRLLNEVEGNKSHPNRHLIQWQYHTHWGRGRLVWMELVWMECGAQTCCFKNFSKLLTLKLLENLGAATYSSCHSHYIYNGRMWRILRAFALLWFLWMRLNCWRSYLYHPYWTHWEDEPLLQTSEALLKEQEEDFLLLATSQDYEKQCGPLKGLQWRLRGAARCLNILTDARFLSASGSRPGNAAAMWRKQSQLQVMMMCCAKGGWVATDQKQTEQSRKRRTLSFNWLLIIDI